MPVITRDVGSFNKTSTQGVTAYGTTVSFNMPAFSVITQVLVSFTYHGGGGQTADRAFLINGSRAHASGDWAQNGMALNPALIGAGVNNFRVALKAQNSGDEYNQYWCDWNISGITLTITYEEPYNPDPDPPTPGEPGAPVYGDVGVAVSPFANIGGAFSVSTIGGLNTWHIVSWQFGSHFGSYSVGWQASYTSTIPIPMNWAQQIPNATSGTLLIEVTVYNTPAPPHNVYKIINKQIPLYVPSSLVPTIGALNLSRIANVPAGITSYVKGFSGVACAATGIAGAQGSTIKEIKITGDGKQINAASGNLSPLSKAGVIPITVTVKDSRGRSASKTATILVLDWSKPKLTMPDAYRSDQYGAKHQKGSYARLKSSINISSLDGENSAILEGRVYQKGGSPPAWEGMTPDEALILGGGLISIERTYIAEIRVTDLLGSTIVSFTIPTKRTAISILSKSMGIAFGKVAETPGILDVAWPIWSEGNPVQPLDIGDVLTTFNATSPALRWPGTVWSAITGRFLLGADATYVIDTTGGAATHTLKVAEMPSHQHYDGRNYATSGKTAGGDTAIVSYANKTDFKVAATGGGAAHNNMPPYLVVYMWRRTA